MFMRSSLGLCVVLMLGLSSFVEGSVLSIDFGDRAESGPGNPVQSGFEVFTITNANTLTTKTYGGISVTVSDTNASGNPILDDRLRAAPANSGGFTQSDLLRDFVFADEGVVGHGLNVLIEGLVPSQQYSMTVWSFDGNFTTATGRLSDWTANGNLVADNYELDGTAPTSNTDKSFSFTVAANGSGAILLSGVQVSASSSVILNGFVLELVPEPGSMALLVLGSLMLSRRRGCEERRRM